MTSVLLTGARGFLGGALLRPLAATSQVYALSRDGRGPALDHVSWLAGDLSHPLEMAGLPERVEAIVHLAQSRGFKDFPASAGDVFAVNVGSTMTLLDYGRRVGIRTFVLASSGGVYGTSPNPLRETDAPKPDGLYAATKYSSELLARAYARHFNVVSLRYFFLYGPGQTGMLIANIVSKVLRRERVVITGNPGIRINPTYVQDAVSATLAALSLDASTTINVAGPETASLTDIVHAIGRQASTTPTIEYQPGGGGDLVADVSEMTRVLRVSPSTGLDDGLGTVVRTHLESAKGRSRCAELPGS
jgi:UDP-glucose 4-epimerase